MSALNSKKTATTKVAKSVSDLVVRRSKRKQKAAPMLTEDVVPAGKYHTEIIRVEDAQSNDGKFMADVTYRFTDSRGKTVEARIRYPAVGYHIERLYDALIDAGLPEKTSLVDAVGIEEEVEVVYPYEGALGKIKTRSPANKAVKSEAKKSAVKKTSRLVDDAGIDALLDGEDPDGFDDDFDDFMEEDIDE